MDVNFAYINIKYITVILDIALNVIDGSLSHSLEEQFGNMEKQHIYITDQTVKIVIMLKNEYGT